MSLEPFKRSCLEEANEHLDTLQEIVKNLDSIQANREERELAHRALFCLRGELGMLGYNSPIAYGFDDCLRVLAQHPKPVDRKTITAFIQLVDLLRQTVQAAADEMLIDGSDWANLKFRSSVVVDALKSDLTRCTDES